MEQVIRSQNDSTHCDPFACDSEHLHLFLKRSVPLASFGIHRPTLSGFPPLRVFEARHLQAQLELNAALFLQKEMQIDHWRRKVQLPETLRWHLADLGGESHLLEQLSEILKHAKEQVAYPLGP